MKVIVVLLVAILAIGGEAMKFISSYKDTGTAELTCEKADHGCLDSCKLTFSPSNMEDTNKTKYQEKFDQCTQSATGDDCDRNHDVKNCFLNGELDVYLDEDEKSIKYQVQLHEYVNI
uniref:Short D7 protein 2 n=1 Tax=Simulium nigrimanum TaxID=683695 RepID=D1FPY6_SIMNI